MTTHTKPQKPTHNICRKIGQGRNVDFEQIGAAWLREDGGLYIKLYGTQIINSSFYAFAVNHQDSQ